MKKLLLSLSLLPLLAFAQTTLPTFWNFSVPGISTPPTGWMAGLGTNGNLTYSGAANSVGGDNIACRLDATGEYLTIWFAEKPGDVSFWAKGTAISPNPPFTGVFDVQESVDGTSWTSMRTFTTASPLTGTMTRYVNTPTSTSRYIRFFYTTKESGSNVALDSVVIKAAPLPSVLLSVKQNGTTLINGNTFVSGNASSTQFILQNNGTATDLKIDSIVVSGTNASDFSIGAFDSTVTFGGGLDSFNVSFTAGAPGSRFGQVTVYSTDLENSPFLINLYAIGGTLATEPTNQVPSLVLSNVKTHTMNISFNKAVGAEHYIVLRKPASSITEVPVDGTTYLRGDYIGGAQVAYIGDDTASFSPNYILAKTNYTFTAFAFSGPAGYENYKTTAAATASTITPDGQPGNYYSGINSALPSFISDLTALIKIHDTIFYSNYAPVVVNNYLARDTSGGKKVVTCVYTGEPYVYEDPFLWWTGTNGNPAVLTREHTFAQSWMPTNTGGSWPTVGGKEVSEYDDLHNLFPANQLTANAKRSNYPFGVVVNATYTSPTGQGKLGTDANAKTVYEPHNDQKGDLARALFYMLVRFNGINGVQWRLPSSQELNVLLQWHQLDPPSPLEIARNQYISTTQKNRNPFIDHPEWVNRINFSNMTFVADTSTVKTVTVTSPNGGETWNAGETHFINWTAANIDSVTIELRETPTSTWETIAPAVAAVSGAFSWLIPAKSTTNAIIRVSEKGNASVMDSSNASFTISTPQPTMTLTLLSPLGGEVWKNNDLINDTIKWTSTGVDVVIIGLMRNDTTIVTLDEVLASENYFVVTDSVISGFSLGNTYKIKLTANNNKPLVSISPNTFSIDMNTGLSEVLSQNNLLLFPNPSSGLVKIDLNGAVGAITVRDITGRLVLEKEVQHLATIELTQQGVYFIKLQTPNGSVVKKVIIE
jgi:endonuclease I